MQVLTDEHDNQRLFGRVRITKYFAKACGECHNDRTASHTVLWRTSSPASARSRCGALTQQGDFNFLRHYNHGFRCHSYKSEIFKLPGMQLQLRHLNFAE